MSTFVFHSVTIVMFVSLSSHGLNWLYFSIFYFNTIWCLKFQVRFCETQLLFRLVELYPTVNASNSTTITCQPYLLLSLCWQCSVHQVLQYYSYVITLCEGLSSNSSQYSLSPLITDKLLYEWHGIILPVSIYRTRLLLCDVL